MDNYHHQPAGRHSPSKANKVCARIDKMIKNVDEDKQILEELAFLG